MLIKLGRIVYAWANIRFVIRVLFAQAHYRCVETIAEIILAPFPRTCLLKFNKKFSSSSVMITERT